MNAQQKADKLKEFEKKLKKNQKACGLSWPDEHPFNQVCKDQALAVFKDDIKVLMNK